MPLVILSRQVVTSQLLILLLSICILSGHASTDTPSDFEMKPEDATYLQDHYFPCYCQAGRPFLWYEWRVNNTIVTGETSNAVAFVEDSLSVLELFLTQKMDGANITCCYVMNDGLATTMCSEPAILTVIGPPDRITGVSVIPTTTFFNVTWHPIFQNRTSSIEPPSGFSVERLSLRVDTDIDPDEIYYFVVINGDIHAQTVDSNFIFIPDDPSLFFEFTVIPVNGAGEGAPCDYITKQLINEEPAFPIGSGTTDLLGPDSTDSIKTTDDEFKFTSGAFTAGADPTVIFFVVIVAIAVATGMPCDPPKLKSNKVQNEEKGSEKCQVAVEIEATPDNDNSIQAVDDDDIQAVDDDGLQTVDDDGIQAVDETRSLPSPMEQPVPMEPTPKEEHTPAATPKGSFSPTHEDTPSTIAIVTHNKSYFRETAYTKSSVVFKGSTPAAQEESCEPGTDFCSESSRDEGALSFAYVPTLSLPPSTKSHVETFNGFMEQTQQNPSKFEVDDDISELSDTCGDLESDEQEDYQSLVSITLNLLPHCYYSKMAKQEKMKKVDSSIKKQGLYDIYNAMMQRADDAENENNSCVTSEDQDTLWSVETLRVMSPQKLQHPKWQQQDQLPPLEMWNENPPYYVCVGTSTCGCASHSPLQKMSMRILDWVLSLKEGLSGHSVSFGGLIATHALPDFMI